MKIITLLANVYEKILNKRRKYKLNLCIPHVTRVLPKIKLLL